MVACVLIPRFALRVASGNRLDGPAALAPAPGERQAVGEVSRAAEAQGVCAGMPLGEALARCPSLQLIPADPARAAERWEGLLGRLEGIGAAVESERAGEAFFAVDGLLALHGSESAGVLAAAREAARAPVRIAAAPNRFTAFLAASRGSRLPRSVGANGEAIVPAGALRGFLAPISVAALGARLGSERQASELIGALKRLGLGTLGKLAALPSDQVADRFGALGLKALRLARGEDAPLRPREPHEELATEIELPDGTAGAQLDRALQLLVDRLLAAPARREQDRAGASPLRPSLRRGQLEPRAGAGPADRLGSGDRLAPHPPAGGPARPRRTAGVAGGGPGAASGRPARALGGRGRVAAPPGWSGGARGPRGIGRRSAA